MLERLPEGLVLTKKDAARDLLFLAKDIHQKMAGDEDADFVVYQLLSIVRGLLPQIGYAGYMDETNMTKRMTDLYFDLSCALFDDKYEAKQVKLRRLIDHPRTTQPERDAALRALARLKGA